MKRCHFSLVLQWISTLAWTAQVDSQPFFAFCCFNFFNVLSMSFFQSFWCSCCLTRKCTFHHFLFFSLLYFLFMLAWNQTCWLLAFFLGRQEPPETCCQIFFFKVSKALDPKLCWPAASSTWTLLPHPTPPQDNHNVAWRVCASWHERYCPTPPHPTPR